jgi:Sulfotransferase domain
VKRLPAELVPTIPSSARSLLRNTVWAYGKATSSVRPLPDFLVIGAQKAGTTALYAYLRWHPGISGPSWKEASFFDRHYVRGEAWYRGHFPNPVRMWRSERANGRRLVVGEASPSYILHPLAPERVNRLIPDVRLVALLRDPIDRAYSHYQHEVVRGTETLPFEEALDAEEERLRGEVERMIADPAYFSHAWWNFTYLARGRYAEQLERWFAVFPREQLLVVASADLHDRPAETYGEILDFIGAERHALDSYPHVFSREYAPLPEDARARLSAYYSEPNRRLYELLGRDFGWQ